MLKPYPAAIFLDIAATFPGEWGVFLNDETDDLEITVTRDLFPNMSGSKANSAFTAYEYYDQGKATLKLNGEIDLNPNQFIASPGLTISAKGSTWTFKKPKVTSKHSKR